MAKTKDIIKQGTAKQKAALMCANWDRLREGKKPLLTEDEADSLFYDLQRNGTDAEKKDYNKWINLHDKITDFSQFIVMACYMATSAQNKVIEYLRMWETYEKEIDHLNALIDYEAEHNPKGVKAFREKVASLPFLYAKTKLRKDGYLELDVDGKNYLYSIIKHHIDYCTGTLRQLKAIDMAFAEWVRSKKAQAFVSELLQRELKGARENTASNIAPAYCKATIDALIAQGYGVTPAEKKKAVYPDYNSLDPDEDMYKTIKGRLDAM